MTTEPAVESGVAGGIPREVALQLCAEIRQAERAKWFSAAHWQCWGCVRFSRGDLAKMCMGSQPNFRGCVLINARFDAHRVQSPSP